MPVRVHVQRVARLEQRGRRRLLDQRRPVQVRPHGERRPPVDGAGHVLAHLAEVYAALGRRVARRGSAGRSRRRRGARAARRGPPGGRPTTSAAGSARRGRSAPRRSGRSDPHLVQGVGVEAVRQRHLHRVLLAAVAHARRSAGRRRCCTAPSSAAISARPPRACEVAKRCFHLVERARAQRQRPACARVAAQVHQQHADGAEVARRRRHQHGRDGSARGRSPRRAAARRRRRRRARSRAGRAALRS